jgi:hypothetical protein
MENILGVFIGSPDGFAWLNNFKPKDPMQVYIPFKKIDYLRTISNAVIKQTFAVISNGVGGEGGGTS